MRTHPAAARLALGSLTLVAAAVAAAATTPAEAAPERPDVTCQRAGVSSLQEAGLLDDVARDGLPISTAVSLGVAPRDGVSLEGVPDPLPLSVVLADHRAGANSLFVYPWC
jgi:hypothetical protein